MIVLYVQGIDARATKDQELVEVETDKSTLGVPSPWKGTLSEQHGEPGDVIEVGSPLFSIDTGEAD